MYKEDDKDRRIEAGAPHPGDGFEPSDHSRFIPGGETIVSIQEEEVSIRENDDEPAANDVESEPATESENPVGADDGPCGESSSGIWKILAHACSWLMVPMLMPVYGMIIIFTLSILNVTSLPTKLWFTAIVFGINVLLPLLVIFVLKLRGTIDDLGLNGRKERLIPYAACILCMGGTALFVATKQAPMWVIMFFAGGAATGIVNLLINFRWKISAHAAGVAGIVALLMRIARDGYPQGDVMLWILVWILIAGLTGTSRLYLRRHTLAQVLAGYATGFCGVFFMTMIQ